MHHCAAPSGARSSFEVHNLHGSSTVTNDEEYWSSAICKREREPVTSALICVPHTQRLAVLAEKAAAAAAEKKKKKKNAMGQSTLICNAFTHILMSAPSPGLQVE